jgi:hypothetical protein
VETLRRPEIHPSRTIPWDLIADAIGVLGIAAIVLAIFEIGGLFGMGLGFSLVWVAMIVRFRWERGWADRLDDEFRSIVDGPI